MTGSGSSALCFGKLPSHADFIRYNAASQEVLAFDDWLHQGLYFARTQLGPTWEQEFAHAPTYRFMFNPENASRSLAGILQASQDKSQRSYPFLASLLLDRHWFREGEAHLAPAAFTSFYGGASQFVRRAMNGLDMKQIAESMQALDCPEPDRNGVISRYQKEFLESYAVDTFWQELLGSFGNPRKYIIFNNLAEVLLPARNKSSRRVSVGLRFPLPGDQQRTDYVVSLWLNIVLVMLGTLPGWPFLFWSMPGDGTRAHLFVFFRQPSPKNFVHLLRPEADSENIFPVEEEGKSSMESAAARIPAALRALLDKREGSLSGFLKGLTVTVS